MKRASSFPRVSLLCLSLLCVWTGIVACGGPVMMFPGGALSGEEVTAPVSWPKLEDGVLELETRPDDPYSVHLGYRVVDGQLMIDPAAGRAWLDNLRDDPRVRVRINGQVMAMRAVLIGDPEHPIQGFEADRFVYRLEPR